tara:strand:+ start:364 stop:1431 length:1068 start_codon:yes stop_codon:yes gene_type:complete
MKFNHIIKIKNKFVKKNRCFVVAEISANHSGNFNNMRKLIYSLKKINVDAIKIQAYEADTITLNSNRRDFKIRKNNSWSKYKTLYELYKNAETPFKWYKKIFELCKKINLIVFASVFDLKSLKLLEKLNCPAYKIASPEITDIPLIESVAKTKKPIIISNGLSNYEDLKLACYAVKKSQNKNLIILKCTSSYPTQTKELNLRTMIDINKKFKCLVGFSDHTMGIDKSIHAASLGANMLEKHVTLNKKTIDGFFSINIKEFKKMIIQIRENEIASGKISYQITKSSKKNLNGRRSLYVVSSIKKNEKFTNKNIKSIRPSYGLHPKYLKYFLNKESKVNIKHGSRLSWKHLKLRKKV